VLTFDQIKELLDRVAELELAGFEIERSGFRLRIEGRRCDAAVAPAPAAAAAVLHQLTSPIVGTFYRAPAADAAPFVEVGQTVEKGQVLCIVEAMKLMNEIESDADGTIVEIHPDNAQAVEFGEPLFGIRTDG